MSEFDPIGSLKGAPPVDGAEVFAALSARLPTLAGQANVKFTLADIATFVLAFLEANIIVGTLTIQSAPSVSGDMIVGERLYATHGGYNLTPDSFTNKWFHISLTNAITAFTRTSSSGVTPMTWSVTLRLECL
jgi:hypothetical protein